VIYLVGAGPGDPGLLTRRGAELLARADVVVYDRLVDPALVALARDARHVYAGKPSTTQDEINELLVREGRAGRTVVRLKGGDPFVFGRGGEECEALADAGVAFEVVPGVTSATAAPAYAGIPLTHRDHASWVAIATGRSSDEGRDLDWRALASAGTAVFLMGVEHLGRIAASLTSAGKPGATPAAVIANATWPSQRVVRTTLDGIAAAAADVEPPAILVVGDVVSLAERIDWYARRPLLGKRVFVTRTREHAGALAHALREAGADALEYPAIRIAPADDIAPLDEALHRVREYDWLIFTSATTVDVIEPRIRDARSLAGPHIAAVGPATAQRLRAFGIRAEIIPERTVSDAIADAIPPGPGRVLIPQAAGARDVLAGALRKKGWDVDVVEAYRTARDDSSVDAGRKALEAGVDAVVFTSGSTVRAFVELWGSPSDALVCCIGPVTADAAAEFGVRVDAVAEKQTIEGLVAALVRAVGR
jgi:uroporphyrinogen III methyltransferase/synthase